MVGGKEEHLDTCRPVFEAMGSRIEHMGGWGAGAAAKLVNQVRSVCCPQQQQQRVVGSGRFLCAESFVWWRTTEPPRETGGACACLRNDLCVRRYVANRRFEKV